MFTSVGRHNPLQTLIAADLVDGYRCPGDPRQRNFGTRRSESKSGSRAWPGRRKAKYLQCSCNRRLWREAGHFGDLVAQLN